MLEREKDGGTLGERMRAGLQELRKHSQLRSLDTPSGISLCSNDYLGLACDPRLKQAAIEALQSARSVGSTGSRLLSGNCAEWEELEREFASFAGAESALFFNSGYAANTGLLSSILQPGDVVFSDASNHASLIDGMRLSGAKKVIYPHRDLTALERSLREHASPKPGCAKVIVTETVFSMEGDIAPLRELLNLAQSYGAELVLDEAHAVGVCGPEGQGIAAEWGCQQDILAIVYTCGKSLASVGAFVCGGHVLKDFLVNQARAFIFSTAMPPSFAGQIRAALGLAREADAKRDHLRALGDLLRDRLRARELNCGSSSRHIVPVILGTNEVALRVAARLREEGFAVKAIRPPTVPAGTARLRLSLTSQLTAADVESIAAGIATAVESLPAADLCSALHA